MGKAEKAAIKRFGRNIFSLLISGATAYLSDIPQLIIIAPAINAVGKWLRDKFGLTYIPF